MHPPALVLPAMHRIIVQSLSFIMSLKISAALAVSRAVKDIPLKPSITPVESKDFISICLTGSLRKSFFFISSSKLVHRRRIYNLIIYRLALPPKNPAIYLFHLGTIQQRQNRQCLFLQKPPLAASGHRTIIDPPAPAFPWKA